MIIKIITSGQEVIGQMIIILSRIADVFHAVFGLLFGLFIPGYLAALLFFRELDHLEKITLGFILSICIDIIIGLILGYNEATKNITGGITAMNLWISLLGISVFLAIALIIQYWEDIVFFIRDIPYTLRIMRLKKKYPDLFRK